MSRMNYNYEWDSWKVVSERFPKKSYSMAEIETPLVKEPLRPGQAGVWSKTWNRFDTSSRHLGMVLENDQKTFSHKTFQILFWYTKYRFTERIRRSAKLAWMVMVSMRKCDQCHLQFVMQKFRSLLTFLTIFSAPVATVPAVSYLRGKSVICCKVSPDWLCAIFRSQ